MTRARRSARRRVNFVASSRPWLCGAFHVVSSCVRKCALPSAHGSFHACRCKARSNSQRFVVLHRTSAPVIALHVNITGNFMRPRPHLPRVPLPAAVRTIRTTKWHICAAFRGQLPRQGRGGWGTSDMAAPRTGRICSRRRLSVQPAGSTRVSRKRASA